VPIPTLPELNIEKLVEEILKQVIAKTESGELDEKDFL
jgi:hypothetical protein